MTVGEPSIFLFAEAKSRSFFAFVPRYDYPCKTWGRGSDWIHLAARKYGVLHLKFGLIHIVRNSSSSVFAFVNHRLQASPVLFMAVQLSRRIDAGWFRAYTMGKKVGRDENRIGDLTIGNCRRPLRRPDGEPASGRRR